ncbi:MAG TPA: CPBP family intramembrane glutamic endopeptidase, partial [Puia sp.]|nr:CPBP family intramembrane glutamic endopeptidase [Puia sp.]
MNTPVGRPPLIRQGWLRVLLFFAAFFVILLIIVIPIGSVIALLNKDAIARGEQINVTELLRGQYLWFTVLVSLVVSLLSVFLFRRFIDRKSFRSLGFDWTGFLKDAGTGFFLAPLILGLGTLILYFSRHLEWMDVDFNGSELFIGFGIMMMVAIGEEVVFRGYILNNLMESFGKWIALIVSAVLFTLFHMANPGINLIPLLNIFLAGILLGINYIYTKNLWFSILFHLSWNFFQGPLFGYKVSGVNLPSLLQTELSGDPLLTGAGFGFEGSVID